MRSLLAPLAFLACSFQTPDPPPERNLEVLVRTLEQGEIGARIRAAADLSELGEEAVPAAGALVAGLSDPDARVRAECARALGAVHGPSEVAVPGLLRAATDDDPAVRIAVRRAIGAYGDPGFEHLMEALARPDASPWLMDLLAAFDESGLAVLERSLDDPRRAERAILVLQTMGTRGLSVIGLAVEKPELRRAAFHALRRLGAGEPMRPRDAEAYLGEHPTDPNLRTLSVWALRGGAPKKVDIADLRRFAGRSHPAERELVLWFLGGRGSEAAPVADLLVDDIGDEDAWIRRTSLWALGSLQQAGTPWTPDFIPGVGYDVGPLGGYERPPMPSGIQRTIGRTPETRRLFRWRIENLDWTMRMVDPPFVPFANQVPHELVDALPSIRKALDDPDPEVRRAAMWTVSKMGATAAEAAPRLVAILTGPDVTDDERRAARDTLIAMRRKRELVEPPLLEAAHAEDPELRCLALEGLAIMDVAEAAPLALPGLTDEARVERYTNLLARLHPMSVDFLEPYIASFRAGNLRAAALLLQLGPPAEPVFVECLVSEDPMLRAIGAFALARIGEMSPDKREALLALQEDADPDVRLAARLALDTRPRRKR